MPGDPPAAPPGRDIRIDNFKGLLIVAVVVGHALEPVLGTAAASRIAYAWIYSFHMPMFVLVSGYLTTPRLPADRVRGIVARLVVPYGILQVIYLLFARYALGDQRQLTLFTPYWLLWYLFALIVWRLVLPLALTVRRPMLLSIVLGLAAGTMAEVGYPFSASRILVMFPYFLAGSLLRNAQWRARDKEWPMSLAIVALAGVVAISAWWARSDLSLDFFYGSRSYAALGMSDTAGVAARAAQYLIAFAAGWAVWTLTPRAAGVLTRTGANSLSIYVLHGFVIKTVFVIILAPLVSTAPMLLPYIVAAILLAFLLGTDPSRRVADFLCGKPWAEGLLRPAAQDTVRT